MITQFEKKKRENDVPRSEGHKKGSLEDTSLSENGVE